MKKLFVSLGIIVSCLSLYASDVCKKTNNDVSVFSLENSITSNQSSDKYICNPTCYFYNWGYIKTNSVFSLYEERKTGKWYVVDAYGNRAWVYKTSNNREFRFQFYMSGYYYFN